jgi:hypothetical protein
MRYCILLLLSLGLLTAEDGGRAEYIGGTAAIQKKASGTLHTTDDELFRFRSKKKTIEVPYERINLLEYGQKVDRRYGLAIVVSPMFLLSKARRHFLTVGYTDEQGGQQALIFRVEKGDIRSVLVGLEARTGRKVQYQDDEARKAGKG